MKRWLALLTVSVVFGGLAAEPEKDKAPVTAKVQVTAELACMHCTFGQGESCALALKLDDKTPLLLEGDAVKDFYKQRLTKKVVVVDGALKLKDKQMMLVASKGQPYDEKDKDKVPAKGTAYIEGLAICGMCDLSLCDACTLAVKNAPNPIILDGKLAADHAEGKGTLFVTGKLQIDARGLLRIDASKVEAKK